MSLSTVDLAAWFVKQPKWLQIAASKLIINNDLKNDDIEELAALCQSEADGATITADLQLPKSTLESSSTRSIRLCAMSDIHGVNKLAPTKPLKFGKHVTLVYGCNGSGKSGYIRLLKHISGARNRGVLHDDAYSSTTTPQNATILFDINETNVSRQWSSENIINELKEVRVFDTSAAQLYLDAEHEVSFEPAELWYFSSLISICDKVAEILEANIARQPTRKPSMPPELSSTNEYAWYNALSSKTTSSDLSLYCSFNAENESKIQKLQLRISEKSPAEKAKSLRNIKKHIDNLISDAQTFITQLSDEHCQEIIGLKNDAIRKKIVADIATTQIFSDSPLEGVGSDIWKDLWIAARKYSTSSAYKDSEFPNVSTDSRCVLCQQELSPDAQTRLLSFERFVQNELQKAYLDAENKYTDEIQMLKVIPAPESLKTKAAAAGLDSEAAVNSLIEFFALLQNRQESLTKTTFDDLLSDLTYDPKWLSNVRELLPPYKTHAVEFKNDDLSTDSNNLKNKFSSLLWLSAARTLSAQYEVHALEFENDALNDGSKTLKKELNALRAKKWLFENRSELEHEIARLQQINRIINAKKLVNTNNLSRRKSELSKRLITDAFIQRFNNELNNLKASHIKVELVYTKTEKGRTLHKIQLRNASNKPLREILSDGENRVIAIAAFLADTFNENTSSPLIFDDPISSLDQDYEEAVANRLIDLSHERQIIIFTHRLSVLAAFKSSKKLKTNTLLITSIRSVAWGTGEPVLIPLSQNDIKSALNILIADHIPKAKKAYDQQDFENSEILIKSICSEFRTLLERVIEHDLLFGIVQRFQRNVSSLKLPELKKLKSSDCDFLDMLMTKYSYFEHSQPNESPVDLPTPADLLTDLKSLQEWRNDYGKQSKSSESPN